MRYDIINNIDAVRYLGLAQNGGYPQDPPRCLNGNMRLNFGDLIFRQAQIVALATPPVGGRVESKPRVKSDICGRRPCPGDTGIWGYDL